MVRLPGRRGLPFSILVPLALVHLAASPQEPHGLPLQGEEAEAFLRAAEVVKKEPLRVGITNSHRLTLTDGRRTVRALWKTIDQYKPGITQFERGGFEFDFRDSYKYEIASYELDKLLALGLVPPTVERRIRDETGAVQLWVEGVMTEADRMKQQIQVKDPAQWNEQIFKVRLLHQLTYNSDYNNVRNILVDPEFRVYAIDFSRAFRLHDELLAEKDLARFSRSALERLRALERGALEEKLGRWLTGREIEGILKRRDRICALADRRVKEKGEAAVLYP